MKLKQIALIEKEGLKNPKSENVKPEENIQSVPENVKRIDVEKSESVTGIESLGSTGAEGANPKVRLHNKALKAFAPLTRTFGTARAFAHGFAIFAQRPLRTKRRLAWR